MKKLRNKILAVMVSVLMIAAYLPANAVPVFAADVTGIEITTPPTITEYHIGDVVSVDGMVVKAFFSDGTENENLTGYTVNVSTVNRETTEFTIEYGGQKAVQEITVTPHQFDENHFCTALKSDGTVCGMAEPYATFVDVEGNTHDIWYSTVDQLDDNDIVTWKNQPVKGAYLTDIFNAIGVVDDDLGDCSLVIMQDAEGTYDVPMERLWLDQMGLFITLDDSLRFILMNHDPAQDADKPPAEMPDGTKIAGGFYSPNQISFIVAKDHDFDENGFCQNGLLGDGKDKNTNKPKTVACNAVNPDVEKYVVTDASQLAELAEMINSGQLDMAGKTIELGADLDLSAYENWTPIGTASLAFNGTFDGKGFAISGLSITNGSGGYKGLFANNAGTVMNFTVSGSFGAVSESGVSYMGGGDCYGVVAYNTGTVSDIVSALSIYPGTGDTYAVGGIVGRNVGGTVERCGFDGAIDSDISKSIYRTGGIVGHLNSGTVKECYNTGLISAWNYRNGCQGTGGIVGSIDSKGTVSYCYNTGEVYNGWGDSATGGKQGAGGIVGSINAGDVDHCYAVADAHGPGSAGVIIGKVGNGTYDHLYSLYTARAYQQYGTKTDAENTWGDKTNVKYSDGSDETQIAGNDMASQIKFGGAAIANSYNGGYTISNSFAYQREYMITQAFVDELNNGLEEGIFVLSCNDYPRFVWDGKAKEHQPSEPEPVVTDPTYDQQGYTEDVVTCEECGNELSRSEKYDFTDSLKDQAAAALPTEEALAAVETAITAVNALNGDEAVAAAEAAAADAEALVESATDAVEKAEIALEAAPDEAKEEAQAAVDAANAVLADAEEVREKAYVALEAAQDSVAKELLDQAGVERQAAQEAVKEVKAHKGEAAIPYAEAALAAAQAALEKAEIARKNTSANYWDDADDAYWAAEDLVYQAEELLAKAEKAAEEAADVRDSAIVTLADLDGQVNADSYKAASYAVYADAYDAFKALCLDTEVSARDFRNARSAVTKAYLQLEEKDSQDLMVNASAKTVGFAALRSGAKKFNLITASGNEGAVTYTKSSGSSYVTVNAATGELTVKKGTPAGAQTVTIKVTAAATDDLFAVSKSVKVTINVSKAPQPMTVKATTKSVSLSKVAKASQTVTGAITVSNAQGTVTYKKIGGDGKLTIDKKSGKITVKKGTKKGNHTITVRVSAAGNKNYNAGYKDIKVTVRVK